MMAILELHVGYRYNIEDNCAKYQAGIYDSFWAVIIKCHTEMALSHFMVEVVKMLHWLIHII